MTQKTALIAGSLALLASAGNIYGWGKHDRGSSEAESQTAALDAQESRAAYAREAPPAEQPRYPPQTQEGSASVASGVTASAALLYWQAKEDGLEYAYNVRIGGIGAGGPPTFIEAKTRAKRPDFSWSPGFQLSLGYIFPNREQWDLSLAWTYLRSKAHGSLRKSFDTIATDQVIPLWISFLEGNIAARASAHWTLGFNTFDLALGRNYFVGKWLAFKPAVGVRGAWINQDYKVRYLATADQVNYYHSFVKCHNDFAGGGIRLGTDMQMFLCPSWSIVGNLFGSLIYGRFNVREFALGKIFPVAGISLDESFDMKDNLTRISPNVDAKLGVQWQRFFHQDRFRVSLAASYNLSYWFNQNQLHNLLIFFNPSTGASYINDDKLQGDLQFQGGSFEMRFEF